MAAPEPEPLPPGYRLADYVVVRELATARMGRVYEAKDTRLNETVAINVLAPQLRDTRGVDRFRGAFRKAFKKNRGRVHQYVEWDGIPFAVLAYSDDGSGVIDVANE